jgi:hypothetical protein
MHEGKSKKKGKTHRMHIMFIAGGMLLSLVHSVPSL